MEVCSHNNSDPQTILLKINGTACNLSCKYCSEVKKKYKNIIDLGEVKELFQSLPNNAEIILHGGEPLLDANYIKETVALFRKYRPSSKLSLQTNGCISEDMKQLIIDNSDILMIGVSIDGPAPLNIFRTDRYNNPSFSMSDNTIRFFQDNGISIKCIVTINAVNVQYPTTVLDYFLGYRNIKQIRFNPCFDVLGNELTSYAVKPRQFLEFLLEIEKMWLEKKLYRSVRIDPLQSELEAVLAQQNSLSRSKNIESTCKDTMQYLGGVRSLKHACCCKFVSIYPNHKYTICDALGAEEFSDVFITDVFDQAERTFLNSLHRPCDSCEYFNDCGGGCVAIFRKFKDSKELVDDYCIYRREIKKQIRSLII